MVRTFQPLIGFEVATITLHETGVSQVTRILNAIDAGDLQAAAQLPAGW